MFAFMELLLYTKHWSACSILLPLNDQHHYVDDSVVRRLSRAGNWWVRDRDHHSESTTGYTFTPCVGSFTSPGIDTR